MADAEKVENTAAPMMPDIGKITDDLLKKLLGAKDDAVQEVRTMLKKAVESFPVPSSSKGSSKVFHIMVYLLALKSFIDLATFGGTGGGEVILKYADLYLARFALLFKQSYGEAKSLVNKGGQELYTYFNEAYNLTEEDGIKSSGQLGAFLTKKVPVLFKWLCDLKIPGLDEWITAKQAKVDCLKRQGRSWSAVSRWAIYAVCIIVPALIIGRSGSWLAGAIYAAVALAVVIAREKSRNASGQPNINSVTVSVGGDR